MIIVSILFSFVGVIGSGHDSGKLGQFSYEMGCFWGSELCCWGERCCAGERDSAWSAARLPPCRLDWSAADMGITVATMGRSYFSLPWHCLYFWPEPQGHGSLRPTLRPSRT